MFERGFDRVKDSWCKLNKARGTFVVELFDYLFDKFSPTWLNYLLLKHRIDKLDKIDNKMEAINTVKFIYKRKQFTKKQMDKLIYLINNK